VWKKWADLLVTPPTAGEPQQRLDLLVSMLHELEFQPNEVSPTSATAERWVSRVAGSYNAESLKDRIGELLSHIGDGIGKHLAAGAQPQEITATKEFGDFIPTVDFGVRMPSGEVVPYAVARLNQLPEQHRLHTLLPAQDFYRYSANQPALVLG